MKRLLAILFIFSALAMAQNFNSSDTVPAAPTGGINVKWQHDSSSTVNFSAYVPTGSFLNYGLLTTKGDLLGFSTLPLRLAVGLDASCLVADSTQALGIKWAACGGSFTAAGDLSGTSSTQTVVGIKGSVLPALTAGYMHWTGSAFVFDTPASGGGMVYPGAGIPLSTGAAWGTSLAVPTGALVGVGQTNTYLAGFKQTMQAGSITAGEAFGGVTVDPSSLVSGDRWYRSDLKRIRFYDGTMAHSLMHTDDSAVAAQMPALTGAVTSTAGTVATVLSAPYKTSTCSVGLGDGLNAIAAGTYVLNAQCKNEFGATLTITKLACFSDNAGTSTGNVADSAATALLTGAVTASSAWASGTQSATTTIASGLWTKWTLVADGTSKQIDCEMVATR